MRRVNSRQIKALVDSHGAALVLYARQWCSAPDDAVQEALMELTQQANEPDDSIAWLFTITKRKAINQTRGDCRRRRRNVEVGIRANSRNQSIWFANELERHEESEKLKVCLGQLESLEREIVVARVWGELTFVQISELVQFSSSSTHRHYQNAIVKLRTALDERTIVSPDANRKDLFRTTL